MNKKAIIAVLSALVLTVVASATLVFTVGQKASADTDNDRILYLSGSQVGGNGIEGWVLEQYYEEVVCNEYDGHSEEFLSGYDEIHIEIPDGVTEIMKGSGYDFLWNAPDEVREMVTYIYVPSSVEYIENNAFADLCCKIEFEDTYNITTIGYDAFRNCHLVNSSFYLSEYATDIDSYAFNGCYGLEEIIVSNDNPSLDAILAANPEAHMEYCKVTFMVDGEIDDEYEYDYSEPFWHYNYDPAEKDGFIFVGWYDENNELLDDETVVTEPKVVHAVWVEAHDVIFNTNGGNEIATVTVAHNGKVAKPTNPVKNNCVFKYWYTTDENVPFDFENEQITDNLTLNAKWENVYVVTFNVDGGSVVPDQQIEKGQKAEQPIAPAKDGYIFKGWYNCNEVYDFNTPVTDNITLTAHWEEVQSEPTETEDQGQNNETTPSETVTETKNNGALIAAVIGTSGVTGITAIVSIVGVVLKKRRK